jgi:hypothetical protein
MEEKEKTYEEFVREKLTHQVVIRHLFSRLGKEVKIETTGTTVKGILKAIDLSYRFLEVEDLQMRKTFFVKFDYIVSIETPSVV